MLLMMLYAILKRCVGAMYTNVVQQKENFDAASVEAIRAVRAGAARRGRANNATGAIFTEDDAFALRRCLRISEALATHFVC